MQIISVVARIFWVRALIALVTVLALSWVVGFTSSEKQSIKLWVMYNVVPPVGVALGVALLVGWLSFSWRAAAWTFGVTLVMVISIALYGGWEPGRLADYKPEPQQKPYWDNFYRD